MTISEDSTTIRSFSSIATNTTTNTINKKGKFSKAGLSKLFEIEMNIKNKEDWL